MKNVMMKSLGNYDEVTTQLFGGCFVVRVVINIVNVVLIFVAVHIGSSCGQ